MEYLQKLNEWVPLCGWEKTHKIWSDGVITKIKRLEKVTYGKNNDPIINPERILNTHIQRYENISLADDDRKKIVRFHRMIGLTYLPNPNNYPQVNHIDANKLNNSLSNLEWCTGEMNRKHARENNLYPEGGWHPRAVIDNETAESIRKFSKENPTMTQTQVGKIYGVSQHTVSRVVTYSTYKST